MAELAWASWRSLAFWRAWTLVGVLASTISAARFSRPPPRPATKSPTSISSQAAAQPRVEPEVSPPAPVADRLLARLEVAETSAEECQLLQRVRPTEDPAVTYAVADVLDRTRFRSVRACVTTALGLQPTPPAQSWLIDLASDPDPDVHRAALEALAAHGDSAAQAVVIEAAHSDDSDIRASAVIALLETRHDQAFSAAVELLNSVDQQDTLLALVDALGKSRNPDALPVLATLIAHAASETHLHAIIALGELGEKKAEPLLSSLLEVGSDDEYRAAATALAKLAPDSALNRLELTLRSASPNRRELALSLLVELKLPGVTEMIANVLRSHDRELAPAALHWLANKPDASLEPEIIELLSQDDPSLQRLAVRALARLGTPSALAALERNVDSNRIGDWVRSELDGAPGTAEEVRARHIQNLEHGTARALAALALDPSEPAQDAVLGYFSAPDRDASQLESVVRIAPASTVQRLLDRAGPAEPMQKLALISGLVARGDPKFSAVLREAARDDDESVRRTALRGLVDLGDEQAAGLVEDLAKSNDANERTYAAQLLSARQDAEATPLLAGLAADANAQVANSAIAGLQTRAPELAATLAQRAYQTAAADDRTTLLSSLSGLSSSLALPIYDLALKDPDDDTALAAVRSLGDLQGPEAAARLLAVANDANRSAEVRGAAAEALLALGGPLVRSNRTLLDSLRPPETVEYACNASYP